ncbi:hypothetical protein JV213_06725 [Plesiomonas shigelloides]|uniref:COG4315 family predicted lipoprotein n=1 Tax=Plesiomonas shigelloides TaxID=703 RepID=UPI001C03B6C7|nr:hypothetical protein [Plesiomonas shigelloides]QWK98329.1 hypothetical protein JV213_06725 [Plesiomonas shigelloides]
MKYLMVMILALFWSLTGVAHAGYGVTKPAYAENGMMVSATGMTLYTFDKDKPGASTCVDACAAIWPPYLAATGSKPVGDFTLVARGDGTYQWAYKGKPLYLYAQDKAKGDKSGDKIKEVWHIVPY